MTNETVVKLLAIDVNYNFWALVCLVCLTTVATTFDRTMHHKETMTTLNKIDSVQQVILKKIDNGK